MGEGGVKWRELEKNDSWQSNRPINRQGSGREGQTLEALMGMAGLFLVTVLRGLARGNDTQSYQLSLLDLVSCPLNEFSQKV